MTEAPVWIHIGLGKTGTTSLQSGLFSKHPEILYLGKNWIDNEEAKAALIKVARESPKSFDVNAAKSVFSKMIDDGWREPEKHAIVLSEEDFTTYRFIDPAYCAKRLRQLFSHAKILLVIREPVDWLESMYFFRLSLRFPEALHGFNPWLRNALAHPFLRSDIGQLQLDKIARAYVDLFGAGNVTVMLYEDFRADSNRFINRVCALLGVDEESALNIHFRDGSETMAKQRITERQAKFMRDFQLVLDGRHADYLALCEPLLQSLDRAMRRKAMTLLPGDHCVNTNEVREKVKTFSGFLERAAKGFFREGEFARAEIEDGLRDRVYQIATPGIAYIAKELNADAGRYLPAPAAAAACAENTWSG